jgi:hypothetical protein
MHGEDRDRFLDVLSIVGEKKKEAELGISKITFQ